MSETRDFWHGRHVVYRCFNSVGALLYVGKSGDVPARFEAHRTSSPWFPLLSRVRLQVFPTHEAALQAERNAILSEGPVFNRRYALAPTTKRKQSPHSPRQINEYGREVMRALMTAHGMTVRDLARLCGSDQYRSSIGHVLSGRRVTCNSQLADRIEATLLGPDSEDRIFLPERHLRAVS